MGFLLQMLNLALTAISKSRDSIACLEWLQNDEASFAMRDHGNVSRHLFRV